MVIEKEQLIDVLAEIFLSFKDPDKGYFKILSMIERLESIGIDVDINEVQELSYSIEREEVK